MNELTLANWKEQYRHKYEGANVWTSKAIESQIDDIQTLLDLQKAEKNSNFRETLDIIKHGCYMRGEKEAQEVIELHRTKYKG